MISSILQYIIVFIVGIFIGFMLCKKYASKLTQIQEVLKK